MFQQVMALRGRSGKDVKKSSYYVWYLGAREAKGVDAMPGAIDYLLERERLQEPFKVTLQVSNRATTHQPLQFHLEQLALIYTVYSYIGGACTRCCEWIFFCSLFSSPALFFPTVVVNLVSSSRAGNCNFFSELIYSSFWNSRKFFQQTVLF